MPGRAAQPISKNDQGSGGAETRTPPARAISNFANATACRCFSFGVLEVRYRFGGGGALSGSGDEYEEFVGATVCSYSSLLRNLILKGI
jgi:hypothetical protein